MEMKQPDVHLKALLNSPVRFTPAVPTPDWSSPLPANPPSTNSSTTATNTAATTSTTNTTAAATTSNLIPQTTETLQTQTNTSQIIVATPGAGAGEPHTTVNLQNCVVTVDLNCKLNLTLINARTRNSEYNPSRFHGVVMRLREPRSTALIFSSGKVVCTGNRNEHAALLATKKFARIIQKLGFNVRFTNFKVQNLVATCDLRFPIKLEDLNNLHGQFSSYEPELFPGLIYRMVKPRIVLMIFVNGKIVFTGGKTRVEIKDSLDTMYPILRSFRKR